MGELIAYDILVLLVNIVGFLIFTIPVYKLFKGMGVDENLSVPAYLGKRKGRIFLWSILLLIALRVSAYEDVIKPVSVLPPVNLKQEQRLKEFDSKEIVVIELEKPDHEAEKQRLIEDNQTAKDRFKKL